MGVLKIPKIPRYGIVLEDAFKDSIFKGVYTAAAKSVEEIIHHNGEKNPGELFINTSIAFIGGRGTGKSSAMNSFAEFLKAPDKKGEWLMEEHKDTLQLISQNQFFVLPQIDATQMGEKETLLGSISAKMYHLYQEDQKQCMRPISSVAMEQKREFVRKAQQVNRLAYLYQTGEWYKCDDELLQNTAGIESLKSEFHELVTCFLDMMMENYKKDSTYLVVVVDDIDMSLENSYPIVDEIRKFLTEKNIIVLTSVYMEQLKKVLSIHFAKTLESKIFDPTGIQHTASKLAEKYIEKIFPVSRQHAMPSMNFEQLATHTVENLVENENLNDPERNYWKLAGIEVKPNDKSPSIMHGVLHLIYRKTLLLLVPNENGRHWLIPQNIRSLMNFILFLKNMKDVAYVVKGDSVRIASDDDLKKHSLIIETNLDDLMRYIVDEMSSFEPSETNEEDNTLAKVLEQLIKELPNWSAETLNGKIVRDILYHINGYSWGVKDRKFYQQIFKDHAGPILDASQYPKLISMGDVMYVLGKIDSKTNSWAIKRLVEIVRVVWSIRATKEFFVGGLKTTEVKYGKYITNKFRCLVGGMMFNPDSTEMLPFKRELYVLQEPNKFIPQTDWIIAKVPLEKLKDLKLKNTLNVMCVCQSSKDISDERLKNWRALESHELVYFEYQNQIHSEQLYVALNYLSIFTNMLSVYLVNNRIGSNTLLDRFPNDKLDEDLYDWQEQHIMLFPFYSLDYMSRFYNGLHRMCCEYAKTNQAFWNALNLFKGCMGKNISVMAKVLQNYVPTDISKTASNAVCCYHQRWIDFQPMLEVIDDEIVALLYQDKIIEKFYEELNDFFFKLLLELTNTEQDLKNPVMQHSLSHFKNKITNSKLGDDLKKDLLSKIDECTEENYKEKLQEMCDQLKSLIPENNVKDQTEF